ncbi:uncharacterized protein LOC127000078 isoform X2 [Eriocheir sinensis]|uniref:uncharacterized protein LOC127000078 isoform X2 n=1 Tax=Eriocheir sinensis TaxID=95602 RepID=UPI0021C61AD0|nr:uncharacterized protein LOC127000078 isoform X2 [Eriocheir sinensis]
MRYRCRSPAVSCQLLVRSRAVRMFLHRVQRVIHRIRQFSRRSAAMSGSEHRAALPPEVPCYRNSRRSTTRSPRDGVRAVSRASSGSSSESPARRQADQGRRHSGNKSRRRMEHARPRASPTREGLPVPSWQVVLDELARLKGDVAKLTASRAPSPQLQRVNFQASTSGQQPPVSPAAFSGFVDSSSEDGEVKEFSPGSSVLLQAAKAFGSLDSASEDIDPQVAAMVNFCFDKGLQEEDYKAIAEDPVTRRPNNCPALAPVECNPQILGALKTDARKADSRLKEVPAEVESRRSESVDGCSPVAITTMDGHIARDAHRLPSPHYAEESGARTPVIRGGAPDHAPHTTDGVLTFREQLRERGISEAGTDIILASWKPGTEKQYRLHLKRWTQFCDKWNVSPFNPTVSNIINFLSQTFNRNVGYETINTARSALSSLGIVVNGCRAALPCKNGGAQTGAFPR